MVDKAHMRVYHLDVNERSHSCDESASLVARVLESMGFCWR